MLLVYPDPLGLGGLALYGVRPWWPSPCCCIRHANEISKSHAIKHTNDCSTRPYLRRKPFVPFPITDWPWISTIPSAKVRLRMSIRNRPIRWKWETKKPYQRAVNPAVLHYNLIRTNDAEVRKEPERTLPTNSEAGSFSSEEAAHYTMKTSDIFATRKGAIKRH
jgi:hypothetical protein